MLLCQSTTRPQHCLSARILVPSNSSMIAVSPFVAGLLSQGMLSTAQFQCITISIGALWLRNISKLKCQSPSQTRLKRPSFWRIRCTAFFRSRRSLGPFVPQVYLSSKIMVTQACSPMPASCTSASSSKVSFLVVMECLRTICYSLWDKSQKY
jgi:hypothetical protein